MSFRILLGWTATISWIAIWAYFLYHEWDSVTKMAFNEWGDFFAGASAPLAFLWLVIGYFQQGDELAQNTRALEQQERALQLQVEELKQSVEQQKEMVKVTQEDLEINRVSINREYQKEKLRAQPLIRSSGGGSKKTNQRIMRHSIKLKNIGHLINRVEILIEKHPENFSLISGFFDNWDYQTEKSIIFNYPVDKTFTASDGFELLLKYFDGLGEESQQVLYFTINASGSIIFSSEKPNQS